MYSIIGGILIVVLLPERMPPATTFAHNNLTTKVVKYKLRKLVTKVVISFDDGKIFLIIPQMGFYSYSGIVVIEVIHL